MFCGTIEIRIYQIPFNPNDSTIIVAEKPTESPLIMHMIGPYTANNGKIGHDKRIIHIRNHDFAFSRKSLKKDMLLFSERKEDNRSFNCSFPAPSIYTSKKEPAHKATEHKNNKIKKSFLLIILIISSFNNIKSNWVIEYKKFT